MHKFVDLRQKQRIRKDPRCHLLFVYLAVFKEQRPMFIGLRSAFFQKPHKRFIQHSSGSFQFLGRIIRHQYPAVVFFVQITEDLALSGSDSPCYTDRDHLCFTLCLFYFAMYQSFPLCTSVSSSTSRSAAPAISALRRFLTRSSSSGNASMSSSS